VSPGINGVIGNNTTDKTTIASVIAGSGIITFYPGTYLIDANTTWPSGKVYVIHPAALIKVASGVTLTINGAVRADDYKIFGNTTSAGMDLLGAVAGVASVRPEWWGAQRNGSSNDAPAINAAIACGEVSGGGGRIEMILSRGVYAINAQVTFNLASYLNWNIRGASSFGTELRVISSGFSGGAGVCFNPIDQGGYSTGTVLFEDVSITKDTVAGGPGSGWFIGTGSVHFNSTILSSVLMRRVYVRGFSVDYYIYNASGVLFENCVGEAKANDGGLCSGSDNYRISAPAGGASTEIHFTNCQGNADATGSVIHINDFGAAGVNLAGIGISGFDFYANMAASSGTYLKVYCTGSGSSIGDLWVAGSRNQFEGSTGAGCTAVDLRAESGGSIIDVHIQDTYMVGYGFYHGVKASTGTSGTIFNLFVTGNWMNNITNEAIFIDGAGGTMYSGVVANNLLRGAGGGITSCGIYVQDMSNMKVSGNVGSTPNLTNAFISVVNGNWISVQGNISGGNTLHSFVNSGTGVNCFFGADNL
jgi:hypothetical protein